jgi:enoyl-CoA hydratase
MLADIVTLEVADHVALVTLNRPPVNALDRAMRERIVALFDEVSERDDIRVAVLTGAGKVFCSGADLKDRPDPGRIGAFHGHNRITRETGNSIRECAKPVIAAINGAALGAGLGLMSACDIFLACEEAVFGMPEINVGLAGGASMLRTLFGRSMVRYMFYTGARIPAAELHRLGVLQACTTREALLPEAMKIAREIAAKSPIAIAYAKQAVNMVDLMPQRDAYRFEQNITMTLSRTEDAQEARQAFLDKRPPVFKGR